MTITISKDDREVFEQGKDNGWITKQSMKKLQRAYNNYMGPGKKIQNCMCNKVNRKIYHNIIYEWYAQN